MKQIGLILGGLIAVAALAFFFARSDGQREALRPLGTKNEPTADTSAPKRRTPGDRTDLAGDQVQSREDLVETSPPRASGRTPVSTGNGNSTIRTATRGTVTVEGRIGAGEYGNGPATRWDEAGTLTLILHSTSPSKKTRELSAEIEAGKFRFSASSDARLQIKDIRLDERFLILEPEFLKTFSPSTFPERIEGRWPGQTILRVFDKGSGRELPTVSVRTRIIGGHMAVTDFPPGEHSSRKAKEEKTPFLLPRVVVAGKTNEPDRQSTNPPITYWVGAPKHAWKRITIDHLAGGEQRVHLVRAASLHVEIGGDLKSLQSPDKTVLRLREPGHRSISQALWSFALDTNTRSIATPPLPVGSWRLCLERGPAYGPQVLVEETVKVLFSDEGRVIRLDLPPDQNKEGEATLEGEIVLSGAFDPTLLTVRAEALEVEGVDAGDTHARFACTAQPDEAMPYRFALPLGRWRVHLEPFGLSQDIDLYASGLRGVDFLPASPAQVEVRVRSKTNGETLHPGQIRWRSGPGTGVALATKANENEPGLYEFQTLPGEIEIRCALKGYRYLARRFEVQSGTNAFVMELDRDCSVRIQFLDGETRVPWQRKHLLSTAALDGNGKLFGASGGQVLFTDEGEYELRFHDFDGFGDPDPVRVRIDCVQREALEIHLQREY